MDSQIVKALLAVIGILLGIIAGLVAAGLSRASGDKLPAALTKAAVAFGGTVTLFLVIERDQLAPPPAVAHLHRRARDSAIVVVDQAGHLFPAEQPAQAGKLLSEFLTRTAASSSSGHIRSGNRSTS